MIVSEGVVVRGSAKDWNAEGAENCRGGRGEKFLPHRREGREEVPVHH